MDSSALGGLDCIQLQSIAYMVSVYIKIHSNHTAHFDVTVGRIDIICKEAKYEPRLIKKVQKAILADYVQRNPDK
jgi:hypothetical protein